MAPDSTAGADAIGLDDAALGQIAPADAALQDVELLEEIGMTGELMVLASERPGRLSQAEVDTVLGLRG